MKKSIYFMAIVAIIAIFSGCTKDGATGPAGPAGTNGNANVETFTYTNQTWQNSQSSWYQSVPAITQTVLDKGEITVYIRQSGQNDWLGLPNFLNQFDLLIGLTYVEVFNITGAVTGNFDIKVVVIPNP